MGTPAAENTQAALTNADIQLLSNYQGQQQAQQNLSNLLLQYPISEAENIVSGNQGATSTALAPAVSAITKNQNQAIESNAQQFNFSPAAQQYANQQQVLGEGTQIAGTQNQLVSNAYQTLGTLGQQAGSEALGYAGATNSIAGVADSTNAVALNAQAAKQQSTTELLAAGAGDVAYGKGSSLSPTAAPSPTTSAGVVGSTFGGADPAFGGYSGWTGASGGGEIGLGSGFFA